MDFGCCLYFYHKIPKKLTGSNGKIGKLIYSYLRNWTNFQPTDKNSKYFSPYFSLNHQIFLKQILKEAAEIDKIQFAQKVIFHWKVK